MDHLFGNYYFVIESYYGFYGDGVHLNDLGNKLIADEMIKFIN